jgi:hypothetical protein
MLASLIGAVGSIAGGLIGSKSADRAAEAQAVAAAAAARRTREGQQRATQYLEPVYNQGMDARRYQLAALGLPGGVGREEFDRAFQESPGYQFQMDQGVQALDRSAAARGMLNSGAQMKSLNRFGQGVANQEFGNYYSRLAQIGGQGVNAAGGLANVATGTAGNLANLALGAGDARASGYINQGNAQIGALQGVANSVADYYKPRKTSFTA